MKTTQKPKVTSRPTSRIRKTTSKTSPKANAAPRPSGSRENAKEVQLSRESLKDEGVSAKFDGFVGALKATWSPEDGEREGVSTARQGVSTEAKREQKIQKSADPYEAHNESYLKVFDSGNAQEAQRAFTKFLNSVPDSLREGYKRAFAASEKPWEKFGPMPSRRSTEGGLSQQQVNSDGGRRVASLSESKKSQTNQLDRSEEGSSRHRDGGETLGAEQISQDDSTSEESGPAKTPDKQSLLQTFIENFKKIRDEFQQKNRATLKRVTPESAPKKTQTPMLRPRPILDRGFELPNPKPSRKTQTPMLRPRPILDRGFELPNPKPSRKTQTPMLRPKPTLDQGFESPNPKPPKKTKVPVLHPHTTFA